MKNEIILYRPNELAEHIEVRLENETVWLNRQQIALLFDRDIKTIGKHIANVLTDELQGFSVVAKFATTATDGKTYQTEHYNLDMINNQYGNIELKLFDKSHDRFLIIDGSDIYHLGASLKDLGKRWFAFSKMDKASVQNILNSILELI